MNLTNPITVTPPSITKADGTVKSFDPIVLDRLDLTIIDNADNKIVIVQIKPIPMPLILWAGEAYTSIGDYTQAMVEDKVIELLGQEPGKVLEGLFMPISLPVYE